MKRRIIGWTRRRKKRMMMGRKRRRLKNRMNWKDAEKE